MPKNRYFERYLKRSRTGRYVAHLFSGSALGVHIDGYDPAKVAEIANYVACGFVTTHRTWCGRQAGRGQECSCDYGERRKYKERHDDKAVTYAQRDRAAASGNAGSGA